VPVAAGSQHPRVKQYVALKRNLKGNPERLVALEGLWELRRAVEAGLELRAFFVCSELLRGEAGQAMASRVVESGVHSYSVSARVFSAMADREGPDGLALIAVLPSFGWDDLAPFSRVVVLDGLEVVGNVGTVVRCADAAGAAVVLSNRRVRLTHPKLVHSSMGASLTVPVVEAASAEEAVEWLRWHGFRIVTTDADAGGGAVSYRRASYDGRVAVVMGSERYGISAAWHQAEDVRVTIPMAGRVDSLNVGNAAVLLLYEVWAQQEPDRFS
jgi:TrmH family RNA methyltransferase